ncbi:hypothetical protein PENSPDRAFT_658727 [Peniophora sp. CONT]|nr:hypothetical protein PENSPDRAFT_658727 [Peniophora sp. CONT]
MAAPSQFGRILKSSKFASFDPALGQVYTAPPAHAARGNYGLKRALHPRRHGIPLTVQAVDSIDQQTEWEPAATEARYVERWETQPAPHPARNWLSQLGSGTARSEWRIDSEFSPAAPPPRAQVKPTARQGQGSASTLTVEDALAAAEAKHGKGPAADLAAMHALVAERRDLNTAMTSTPTLNPDALSPERFARYLHDVRGLRSRFKRFITERAKADAFIARVEAANGITHLKKPSHVTADMVALSVNPIGADVRKAFLAAVARERYTGAHGGVAIAAQPHRAAGLTYAPPAPLTHFFLSKPEPARYIDVDGNQNQNQALFGGVKVDFDVTSKRKTDGAPSVRVVGHSLSRAPAPGRGMADVDVYVRVADVGGVLAHRPAQARPGSRAWAAGSGSRVRKTEVLPLTTVRQLSDVSDIAFKDVQGASQVVLDMLSGLISDVPEKP